MPLQAVKMIFRDVEQNHYRESLASLEEQFKPQGLLFKTSGINLTGIADRGITIMRDLSTGDIADSNVLMQAAEAAKEML